MVSGAGPASQLTRRLQRPTSSMCGGVIGASTRRVAREAHPCRLQWVLARRARQRQSYPTRSTFWRLVLPAPFRR